MIYVNAFRGYLSSRWIVAAKMPCGLNTRAISAKIFCTVAGAGCKRTCVQSPVPLILYSQPSITCDIVLAALERHNRPWRIVCKAAA